MIILCFLNISAGSGLSRRSLDISAVGMWEPLGPIQHHCISGGVYPELWDAQHTYARSVQHSVHTPAGSGFRAAHEHDGETTGYF